jgi:hypothetical protein
MHTLGLGVVETPTTVASNLMQSINNESIEEEREL